MAESIKILGKLAAGRADGVLIDDISVRGGYKVVQTIEERDAIPSAITTVGTPAYVAGEVNKLYRWNGSEWVEETAEFEVASVTEEEINSLFTEE